MTAHAGIRQIRGLRVPYAPPGGPPAPAPRSMAMEEPARTPPSPRRSTPLPATGEQPRLPRDARGSPLRGGLRWAPHRIRLEPHGALSGRTSERRCEPRSCPSRAPAPPSRPVQARLWTQRVGECSGTKRSLMRTGRGGPPRPCSFLGETRRSTGAIRTHHEFLCQHRRLERWTRPQDPRSRR